MTVRRPVLLTVSGEIPADLDRRVAEGLRPRADYVALRDALDADVVDVAIARAASGRTGRLVHRVLGVGPLLGWFCFRRRREYDVIVTDGEQVGIPLALLSRIFGRGRARHAMIVHIISVPKKAMLMRVTRLATLIDRYIVYSSKQGDFVRDDLGVPESHIVLSTFMVDAAFFDPDRVDVEQRPMICSAGLERRDYPTLMRAVDGLDVDVVIAAASPWSKRSDSTEGETIPSNVVVQRFDLFELRELYASAQFVVMPLENVDFQAGITSILEAMSMERAVLCTRTPGQVDTIDDDVNGRYVEPADADALRREIVRLLGDEAACRRLGGAARSWVIENADIDRYAERLADVVASLTPGAAESADIGGS